MKGRTFRMKNAPRFWERGALCKTTENEIPERQKRPVCGETAAIAARAVAHGLAVSLLAGTASLSRISSFRTRPACGRLSPEAAHALGQHQNALFPKWFAIYQLCVSERQDKGSGGKHPADFRMAVLQKGKRTPRRYCPAGLGFSPRSEWSSSRGPSAHPSWGYLRAEHRSRKRP